MALAKEGRTASSRASSPNRPSPRRSIRRRYATGEVSLADLATEYSVGCSTVHRIIHGPADGKS